MVAAPCCFTHRVQVEVFLAGWHVECCEPPPAVGDDVAWRLLWVPDLAAPGATRIDWDTQETVTPDHDYWGEGAVLGAGGLRAFCSGDPRAPVPTSGALVVELHGPTPGRLRPTAGRVAAIAVVERAFRAARGQDPGGRSGWIRRPVPGDFALRPVTRCPSTFREVDGGAQDGEDPAPSRTEDGVLVRLTLATGR